MRVLVNVKKLGKRKNSITKAPYELPGTPKTVEELITMMTGLCVRDYNRRMENGEVLDCLTKEAMEEKAGSGKIAFGVNYGEKQADEAKAAENAVQCFEDGIYRIFSGEKEWKDLKEEISLNEDVELTFIRLTMLTGRMW